MSWSRHDSLLALSALHAGENGRDELRENWPHLYTPQQGAAEPADELVQLERGADYGWPYCYFDLSQSKDVRMCEKCGEDMQPVARLPGLGALPELWTYRCSH